ncbi:Bug family tripartite tricarboxylate transporter substrate binding protein [Bordetella petrii]|uniref:Bug family tripartite tricarboxylate transporter substrate binding protein n=1 Tax=Bordetella petrii TaxID=94624 RepID=UPI001E5378CA|nr:tripartite tricarboxylate transporter substrate binding protein [Bordetella petrii]MCD0504738.1 tripartite tricarboxylate transporter substrate binding protein [Bordetella petrii]
MNTDRRIFLARGAALGMAVAMPWAAHGRATYPDRPINVIVPYPPGAATDRLGRLAGQCFSDAYGQPVVVENRGGGGTTIGTRAVATAAADGYTLGFIDSTFTINPGLLGDRLPYDTFKDFAPVSLMATAPFVMVVHPSVPAGTLAEFVALAKAKPGSLSYGSAGVGSGPHLAGEQLRQQAGINVLHVPYRGGGTVFTDLLAGQIQFAFATVPTLAGHIKAGRLRALAVTSEQRAPQLPDVPTFREAGLAGVDTSPLFGLVAPAGVPRDIIDKLAATLDESVRAGDLNKKLAEAGFTPVGSGPAAFGERIRADVRKWTELIQRGGIRAE